MITIEERKIILKLYFIRHGQTQYNIERKLQGNTVDSPLTQEGIEGAKKVGERLSNVKFDCIYSSPLKRTLDTTAYIMEKNQYGGKLKPLDGLKEMGFGDWEGKTLASVSDSSEIENLRKYPDKYDPSSFSGESYRDVIKRGKQTVETIVKENPNAKNILVVSHGAYLTSVIQTLVGVPLQDIRKKGILDNTSISILQCEGPNSEFKLLSYNK